MHAHSLCIILNDHLAACFSKNCQCAHKKYWNMPEKVKIKETPFQHVAKVTKGNNLSVCILGVADFEAHSHHMHEFLRLFCCENVKCMGALSLSAPM